MGLERHLLVPLLAAISVAPAAAQRAPGEGLVRVEWHGTSDTLQPRVDKGRGVIAFVRMPGGPGGRADTLALFADTATDQPLGLFLLTERGTGYVYAVASRDSLRPNILEFDYEIAGLPFDSVLPGDRWARVIYGIDRQGRHQRAWAPLVSGHAHAVAWDTLLAGQALFFADGVSPRFHRSPGGPVIAIDLGRPRGFIMHPLEVRGAWMRVRVAVPSDFCPEPGGRFRMHTAWIRYLDESGRPRVWYFTRGC